MSAALSAEEQWFIDVALAGAPALTSDQIVDLRRLIKPEQRLHTAPLAEFRHVQAQPQRRAAA